MSEQTMDDLKHELEVTDELLKDEQRVLDAIPPCPVHGRCIPHALDWIKRAKAAIETLDRIRQENML